jgi:hypothetical protein
MLLSRTEIRIEIAKIIAAGDSDCIIGVGSMGITGVTVGWVDVSCS